MYKPWLLPLLLLSVLLVAGCAQVNIDTYADNRPLLRPETFFDGRLSAHGVVKNRGGKVLRYFNASIDAHWDDGVGTLDEEFVFNDGERQRRVWTLRPAPSGGYTATAGDVVGEAAVEAAGNSMHLSYVLAVAYGDGTVNLNMDDWMYRVDENTVINHTIMRKFGFKVGEVVLTIVRHE